MVYLVFKQYIYTCRAITVSFVFYRTADLTAAFTRCPMRTCEAQCLVWAESVRYKLACDCT